MIMAINSVGVMAFLLNGLERLELVADKQKAPDSL